SLLEEQRRGVDRVVVAVRRRAVEAGQGRDDRRPDDAAGRVARQAGKRDRGVRGTGGGVAAAAGGVGRGCVPDGFFEVAAAFPGLLLLSFPFKGKAGMGMGFRDVAVCRSRPGRRETHPYPTLPLKGRASKRLLFSFPFRAEGVKP